MWVKYPPTLAPSMNTVKTLLLAVFITLGGVWPAHATIVIPPDFSTMVQRADVIFRGQVTGIRSEWSGEGTQKAIFTYVTFDVQKTLKGEAKTPYVLKMLGGVVGDDVMQVDGVPKFTVGDKTILFVENNGTQFFPVVGIMHGYFKIDTDPVTKNEVVLKYNGTPLQGTADIDREHQVAVTTSGMV